MKLRQHALILTSLLSLALAACGGGGSPASNPYGPLDFEMITNPSSTVQAAQVTGQYAKLTDTAFSWVAGQLPAGSTPLAGMSFAPATAPGTGFSGILRAVLDTERGTSAVVTNQTVDVYSADVDAHSLQRFGSTTTGPDGRFSLPLNFLGFLVFATSTQAQPFTVAAFADLAAASTGTVINFHAIPSGGTAPITYLWDFGDGQADSGETTTHAYAAAGAYNVALTATDAGGLIAPAVSTAIVITSTSPPLTSVTANVIPGAVNTGIFNYGATANGGTLPLQFSWDFGDGTPVVVTATGATTHTFAVLGLYNGTVTVTDALGANATANIVSDARPVPHIVAVTPTEAPPGDPVIITGDHFGTQGVGDEVLLGAMVLPIDTGNGGWTDTSIAVTIPAGAANGNILVHRVFDSNVLPFHILPATPGAPGGGQY